MTLKFCKDCKYFKPAISTSHAYIPPSCTHSDIITYNLVTGSKLCQDCTSIRNNFNKCSPNANWFEQKNIKVTFKQKFMARLNWWLGLDFNPEHLKNFKKENK